MLSRFPLAFRPTGIRFLSRPVPPETSAFLTVGPPPPTKGSGLRRGFHVPRMRDAAGVGALYAPGRRCPPGRRETSARRLPPHSGPPLPRCCIPPAGASLTRRHRGFTGVRPSGLPLACHLRVERRSLGFFLELRTPPLPATHVQAGTGHRTRTRDYPVIGVTADPLSESVHSAHATSCRTFTWRVLLSCDDLDPRQVPSLQVRGTLHVSDHPPDTLPRESARLKGLVQWANGYPAAGFLPGRHPARARCGRSRWTASRCVYRRPVRVVLLAAMERADSILTQRRVADKRSGVRDPRCR